MLVLAAVCGGWTKHYSFRHRDVGVGIASASVPIDARKADLWDKAAAQRTNRCETTIVTGVQCVNTKTRVICAKPKPANPSSKPNGRQGLSKRK